MTCGYPWRSLIGSDHECKLPENHAGVHVCTCANTHDGRNARDHQGKFVRERMSGQNDRGYMEAMQDVYDRVREHLIEATSEGGRAMPHDEAVEWVDGQLEGFVLFPKEEDDVAS